MPDPSSSLPAEAPREIPAEAVEAVIEGIDHESIERHGLDRPAILAILRAAAPFLAGAETVRAKALHSRDDSNPRGPWCGTCTTQWPCHTWIALLPAARPEGDRPMTADALHNAIHDRISMRIAENYESPEGCMPDRLNPSAVATIATPAALAAIEEEGKAVVDVSDLVAAITVLATADDTCTDAACWREACQLLVRLRAALPDVALEPPGTLQDVRPARDGMSGRSDDPQSTASLSEPQPWKGNAVVLTDGQEIPVRADLTIQPAAWSIDAHLNPADGLYLPLGSCVIRLPDGREGAAVVTSVQNGVCGSLSGVGPPPTSKPLPTPIAEEKPHA